MRNKYNRSKKYDTSASYSSVSNFLEKTWIIALSFAFSGINLIVSGIHLLGTQAGFGKGFIALGAVLMLLVPLHVLDKRVEMRGALAAVFACAIHLVFCVMLAYIHSLWWMAVYACQLVICAAVLFGVKKYRKRSRR